MCHRSRPGQGPIIAGARWQQQLAWDPTAHVMYDETNFQRQIAPRTHVPFVVKAEDPRPDSTGRLACLPTAQYYATATNDVFVYVRTCNLPLACQTD